MKHKHMMLSMMMSSPKQPRNDIYAYLTTLVKDLRIFSEEGLMLMMRMQVVTLSYVPCCYDAPFFAIHVQLSPKEKYFEDDVHVIRGNHQEGIWEK